MSQKKYFSGNTLEQAVLQGARFFDLDPAELAYHPVERRHGFLKVRRRFLIEVDRQAPRQSASTVATEDGAPKQPVAPPVEAPAESPQPRAQTEDRAAASTTAPAPATATEADHGDHRVAAASRSGSEPRQSKAGSTDLTDLPEGPRRAVERYPRAVGEFAEAADEALKRLLALGSLEAEWAVLQGDEGLEIEVWGGDEELLLEDRGRLLLAMQHLLPRMIRGLSGGESVPCRVDCDNFQEIRTEQLRAQAQEVAHQVRQNRESQLMEPMSPDERRIVHLTLTDDPSVETESQGRGLFKRVMVRAVR